MWFLANLNILDHLVGQHSSKNQPIFHNQEVAHFFIRWQITFTISFSGSHSNEYFAIQLSNCNINFLPLMIDKSQHELNGTEVIKTMMITWIDDWWFELPVSTMI